MYTPEINSKNLNVSVKIANLKLEIFSRLKSKTFRFKSTLCHSEGLYLLL
jgi:hypothetical protein